MSKVTPPSQPDQSKVNGVSLDKSEQDVKYLAAIDEIATKLVGSVTLLVQGETKSNINHGEYVEKYIAELKALLATARSDWTKEVEDLLLKKSITVEYGAKAGIATTQAVTVSAVQQILKEYV